MSDTRTLGNFAYHRSYNSMTISRGYYDDQRVIMIIRYNIPCLNHTDTWIKYDLDRNTTHTKFDLFEARTHDLQIYDSTFQVTALDACSNYLAINDFT